MNTSNICSLFLMLSSCASFEERLCNQQTASQKAYADVVNGRILSPGLSAGAECKKSKEYSVEDYNRDYKEGFEKAKKLFCTSEIAKELGRSDAASEKSINSSTSQLNVCLADKKIKINLISFYEIGFKDEFCRESHVKNIAIRDAEGLKGNLKSSHEFALCAEKKASVYEVYKDVYDSETLKQYQRNLHSVLNMVTDAHILFPQDKRDCIERFGKKVCGYGCEGAYGDVKCGELPGMKCTAAYGEVECGYDCKAAYGKVVCAKRLGDNCMAAYGDIKCGRNCKAEFGKINCE